jgi:hypothetical protein
MRPDRYLLTVLRCIRPPLNTDCNKWKTEKRHECTYMGKVKRLKLWWQLYLHVISGSGLRKIQAMDFCETECTGGWMGIQVSLGASRKPCPYWVLNCRPLSPQWVTMLTTLSWPWNVTVARYLYWVYPVFPYWSSSTITAYLCNTASWYLQ